MRFASPAERQQQQPRNRKHHHRAPPPSSQQQQQQQQQQPSLMPVDVTTTPTTSTTAPTTTTAKTTTTTIQNSNKHKQHHRRKNNTTIHHCCCSSSCHNDDNYRSKWRYYFSYIASGSSSGPGRRILLAVLFVLLLLPPLLFYSVYQYGYVYPYVYRPHYKTDQALFRIQRFPSIQQRVQLYMSHWYNHNHNHNNNNNECSHGNSSSSGGSIGSTSRQLMYYYSNEQQRDDGTKFYELSQRRRQSSSIVHNNHNHQYDDKDLDTDDSDSPTFIVANQVQVGMIFYIDYEQLQQCYNNRTWSIRYYCRDMMESLLLLPPYQIRPLFLLRFLSAYTITFEYIVMPYVRYVQQNYHLTNLRRRRRQSLPPQQQPQPIPPILVQFSDETDSWISVQSSNTRRMSNNYNQTTHVKLVRNPPIPHIKKIRLALPKHDIDHVMTRTIASGADDEYQYQKMEDDVANSDPTDDPSNCLFKNRKSTSTAIRQQQPQLQQPQPILWLLNHNRHFKYTWDINRYDQSYDTKKNMSVFRGMLTGPDIAMTTNDDDYKNCMTLPRCKLVYTNNNSTLVDAKITDTLQKLPDIIMGRNITGPHVWKEDILSYKGIIIVEGNDVSSGLKWAMISNSVVLMPPSITVSSWAMEELLQPYIHYIPIDIDTNNIEEQTLWMIQHPLEVQRIIHRAKLWILDLYFHPRAMAVDAMTINQEILRRYNHYFVYNTGTNTETRVAIQ